MALWRQLQHQFFFVIGEGILNRRHFWVSRQRGLQGLRGGFKSARISTGKLYIQSITARARSPAAETNRLYPGVPDHRILQIRDKGKGRIRSQIRINQLNGNRAQLVGIFGICSRQSTARIAANFGHGEIYRISPVFLFVLGPNGFYSRLKRAHLL